MLYHTLYTYPWCEMHSISAFYKRTWPDAYGKKHMYMYAGLRMHSCTVAQLHLRT